VTKNASRTRGVSLAATTKHGQAAVTTGESSLDYNVVLNRRTASYEANPAVYKIHS